MEPFLKGKHYVIVILYLKGINLDFAILFELRDYWTKFYSRLKALETGGPKFLYTKHV